METVPISQFKARCLAILARVKRTDGWSSSRALESPWLRSCPRGSRLARGAGSARLKAPGASSETSSRLLPTRAIGKCFESEAASRYTHLDRSVLDRKRLSKRVASVLESPKNELWLSPISVWELLLLTQEGRVSLDRPAATWIADVLAHQDPADRFIAATARVYDLTLVTADERLLKVGGLAVLPNR
jgi:PIN domain nuclease of toxin-antitoxin system